MPRLCRKMVLVAEKPQEPGQRTHILISEAPMVDCRATPSMVKIEIALMGAKKVLIVTKRIDHPLDTAHHALYCALALRKERTAKRITETCIIYAGVGGQNTVFEPVLAWNSKNSM